MSVILLMAGGTGGHLFPAMALAQELRRRGHVIHLMTDERVASYGDFPASRTHIVPSATPSIRNPLKLIAAAATLGWGTLVAWQMLGGIRADVAVAFGGYPTVPSFLAARFRGVPGIIHDSNAVLGRANHLLARFANVVALSFAKTSRIDGFEKKVALTGNPVRDRVGAVANTPYPPLGDSAPIQLLVFGGSQGARVFAELVPAAIEMLPAEFRARLRLVQQCRVEDLERVAEAYRRARVNVELAPFFPDLPERIANSHLVIARSGGGTVAELCVIGRPAILVPLPGAIDADQKMNALVLDNAAAAGSRTSRTSPQWCSPDASRSLFDAPDRLERAAVIAKSLGQPDAVALLADLAEKLAQGKKS